MSDVCLFAALRAPATHVEWVCDAKVGRCNVVVCWLKLLRCGAHGGPVLASLHLTRSACHVTTSHRCNDHHESVQPRGPMALEVWHGGERHPDALLEGGVGISVGRRRNSTFVLDDLRCSSDHLTFIRDAEGVDCVTDLSSNGTFLNGERMVKGQVVTLQDGDILSPVVITRHRPDSLLSQQLQIIVICFVYHSDLTTLKPLAPTPPSVAAPRKSPTALDSTSPQPAAPAKAAASPSAFDFRAADQSAAPKSPALTAASPAAPPAPASASATPTAAAPAAERRSGDLVGRMRVGDGEASRGPSPKPRLSLSLSKNKRPREEHAESRPRPGGVAIGESPSAVARPLPRDEAKARPIAVRRGSGVKVTTGSKGVAIGKKAVATGERRSSASPFGTWQRERSKQSRAKEAQRALTDTTLDGDVFAHLKALKERAESESQ